MSTSKSTTRSHEHVLAIAASPEVVWSAITTAAELVRWFPLAAETRPGVGGEIVYRWGELEGRCRILAWDPPRHLGTTWMEAPLRAGDAPEAAPASAASGEPRAPLCVDWFLEGDGERTVLRLVHSGFGHDARWDEEYDGTRRGWSFELCALRHYLERQRGQERRAFWVRRAVSADPAAVWQRFAVPGGVFRAVRLDSLGPGDRYRLERADGEVLEGSVLLNAPPFEFAGTLDSHGGALLRFGYEACMGGPEAHVWVATWGRDTAEVDALESRWSAVLRQAFGR